MAKVFLDTNIIVYAFSSDVKARVARPLLEQGFSTSVQALNEFLNVSRRRLGMSLEATEDTLLTIRLLCDEILPVDLATHDGALQLLRKYNFSIFDALMISSALIAGCDKFLSEDLQDGLKIADRLTIENPFRKSQSWAPPSGS